VSKPKARRGAEQGEAGEGTVTWTDCRIRCVRFVTWHVGPAGSARSDSPVAGGDGATLRRALPAEARSILKMGCSLQAQNAVTFPKERGCTLDNFFLK
jgi:hypothetical protein